jgi:hypothetical protein
MIVFVLGGSAQKGEAAFRFELRGVKSPGIVREWIRKCTHNYVEFVRPFGTLSVPDNGGGT